MQATLFTIFFTKLGSPQHHFLRWNVKVMMSYDCCNLENHLDLHLIELKQVQFALIFF